MKIKVRQYNPQTDEALIEYQDDRTVIHTENSEISTPFSENEFLDFFTPDGFWLAFEGDRPIGAILVGPDSETENPYAEVYAINVDETFRQKGIGGLLMHKADLYADKHGLKNLVLHTAQDNDAALTLFRKCWFNVVETSGDVLTMVKSRVRKK